MFGELIEERRDAARVGESRERRGARGGEAIAPIVGGHQREGEDGRVVLDGVARERHLCDRLSRPRGVLGRAGVDDGGGLLRQLALAGVVGAAVGAKNQEPAQARPVIQFERVAARGVAQLLALAALGGAALGGLGVALASAPHVIDEHGGILPARRFRHPGKKSGSECCRSGMSPGANPGTRD